MSLKCQYFSYDLCFRLQFTCIYQLIIEIRQFQYFDLLVTFDKSLKLMRFRNYVIINSFFPWVMILTIWVKPSLFTITLSSICSRRDSFYFFYQQRKKVIRFIMCFLSRMTLKRLFFYCFDNKLQIKREKGHQIYNLFPFP